MWHDAGMRAAAPCVTEREALTPRTRTPARPVPRCAHRVNGNLNLSRAIGDLKYKGNSELPPKDQIITAQPDIMHIALSPEDRFFVLACDGVWDVMTNQVRAGRRAGVRVSHAPGTSCAAAQRWAGRVLRTTRHAARGGAHGTQEAVDFIGARLDQGMTPAQAASALLDACLANDPKEARGVGCDNMTSVVVQLKHIGAVVGAPSGGAAAAAVAEAPASAAEGGAGAAGAGGSAAAASSSTPQGHDDVPMGASG